MALVGVSKIISEDLCVKAGVLKTTGALVSMQVPPNWRGVMREEVGSTSIRDRWIQFENPNSPGAWLGLFLSGKLDSVASGQFRRQNVFDKQFNFIAGSADAIEPQSDKYETTRLGYALMCAGRMSVPALESNCLSLKTVDFKNLNAVVAEIQFNDLDIRCTEYIIDTLGDGRLVYSLFYRAPIKAYEDNFKFAAEAFESSIWRTDFDPEIRLEVVA